jgi:tyrosyl-tRNA synthetase
MKIDTDEKKIDELLTRGVAEVIHKDNLRKRLLSGEQLRIKLGIDPTSPNLHIGRSVALLKLRDFQKMGHQIVLIVGDATGVIGDTSDKESERPMLMADTISENKKAYFEQAAKIIDLDAAEFRFNSEWLNPLGYPEIGEHADQFSVADFIARENIKKRLDEGKRVSLRELLYPLMQGYDSVAINADVELGGTDQKFNLLAGRTLQEHFGRPPQDILMTRLISGLDGRKMSSSWGNTINLLDSPRDMYGKVMSMGDSVVFEYFEVATRVPIVEIEEIKKEHPKDAKMRLAREIVALYHSTDAARDAEDFFIETFSKGEVPADVPIVSVKMGTLLLDAIMESKLVESRSDGRRLFEQGAISLP